MPTHVSTTRSENSASQTLILSLGPSRDSVSTTDEDELLTMGVLPLESIPRLGPFVEALAALRTRHPPVVVRYVRGGTTPLLHVAHVECQLESAGQQPLLQRLFHVRELTSYDITLPRFGKTSLRKMRARYLEAELTLRGELPSALQFLCALEAEALRELVLCFVRNQFESESVNVDWAYLLELPPAAYANLRSVRLQEEEEHERYSHILLARVLQPFFGIRELEAVAVVVEQSPLCMVDRDIGRITQAWKDLRKLELSCTRCVYPVLTLDSLYTLADSCRKLEELVLPQLDLATLGEIFRKRPPKEPQTGRPGHPLRVFKVACNSTTHISDGRAMEVARCVDSLFPNIDVKASWSHDGSIEVILSDWYLIWVNITVCQLFRKYAPGRAYLDRPSGSQSSASSEQAIDGWVDPATLLGHLYAAEPACEPCSQ